MPSVDDKTRDLIGQIAAIRATLALLRYQPEDTIIQARRALEYLHSDNLPFRSRAIWTLGFAHQLRGTVPRPVRLYTEAIAISQSSGNKYYTILSTTSLGRIQESENQLYQAAETYRRSLQLLSDQGPPNASEEYIGLARICYEWNDLDAAEQYGQLSLQLARQYDRAIDRFIISEVFLARLKLARGDVAGAAAMLAETEQSVRQNDFVQRMPEVAAAQVLVLLKPGQSGGSRCIWRRRTNSPSARPGCTWPKGIQPQRWLCCRRCVSRWKQRAGRMNGSRAWCSCRSRCTAHGEKDRRCNAG